MKNIWKRAVGAALLSAAAASLAATPASAAQTTLVAGPYAAVTGFATPQVVLNEGDGLSFLSADVSGHRVEATSYDAEGMPLFSSPLASVGQTVPVFGVETLAPGSYGFFCTLHTTMTGTITVLAK